MKYLSRFLAAIAMVFFASLNINAQCEPDIVNCVDTGDPGQICPANLPDAVLNEAYDEVITVIAPDTASLGAIQIGIAYIIVDSVLNLPPGINYSANAEKFYPDSAYCIQIAGTPSEAGRFPLKIYVSAFIDAGLGIIINGGQIVDSTAVALSVSWPSGIDPHKTNEFHLFPNAPNPFSDFTRLGFYTPFDDHVTLQVYNILGELMHEELNGASPGENYFDFNGSELNPGTYFYRVGNKSELFTGKFIKTK
jgi:hypothetical protein